MGLAAARAVGESCAAIVLSDVALSVDGGHTAR
jgi:hypothetical protein